MSKSKFVLKIRYKTCVTCPQTIFQEKPKILSLKNKLTPEAKKNKNFKKICSKSKMAQKIGYKTCPTCTKRNFQKNKNFWVFKKIGPRGPKYKTKIFFYYFLVEKVSVLHNLYKNHVLQINFWHTSGYNEGGVFVIGE